jgi:hypothetical protein
VRYGRSLAIALAAGVVSAPAATAAPGASRPVADGRADASAHGAGGAHASRRPSAQTSAVPAATDPLPAGPGPDGVVDGGTTSGDPLAGNGLGGALCARPSRLSRAAGARCQASGTVSADAPLSHWGFDVHIDTGVLGVSGRTFQAALQTLILTPGWWLLTWLTHALLGLLEWCYSLDLLDGHALSGVQRAMSGAQRAFTDPWLVLVLAIAAVGLVWQGVVRRRVIDSLGEAAAMGAMLLCGLWIIAAPFATVGRLSQLADQASLGTLAAVTTGRPDAGSAALGDGLGRVFDAAMRAPWCYLEFGDIDFCTNPRRLDHAVRRAALKLERSRLDDAGCPVAARASECPQAGDGNDDLRRQSVLLAKAQTNGELFLALPANDDDRNGISGDHPDSLYRALCHNDDDNHCRGPSRQAAQWRTEQGTWPRTGGLCLIALGLFGMLALLGFIAARLLGSALLTVLYLLLAPVAVLMPALGRAGRETFIGWGTRLLGAVLAKLVYSVLLGVVLVVLRLLQGMGNTGWWTQWLLIGAFWWIVFAHRHEVLRFARLGHADAGHAGMRLAGGILAARQISRTATGPAMTFGRSAAAANRSIKGAASTTARAISGHRAQRSEQARIREQGAGETLRSGQTDAVLRGEQHDAAQRLAGPVSDQQLAALRTRRGTLAREEIKARQTGDTRRAARLAARGQRVGHELTTREAIAGNANDVLSDAARRRHATGEPLGARERLERQRWLDHQATLRRGVVPGPRADAAAYRDYPRLAPLGGHDRASYLALAPGEQRQARLRIDRALAARVAAPAAPEPRPQSVGRRPPAPVSFARSPEDEQARRRRQFARQRDDD